MNQQTDSQGNNSIINTLNKVESVISTLANTVEESRRKIEHVADLSVRSTDELKHIRDAVMPYVGRARDASRQVVSQVRANPRPLALILAGIVGGLLLWSFYQNRSLESSDASAIH